MTDPLTPADTRQRSSALWLVAALLVIIAAGSFLWVHYSTGSKSVAPQQKAEVASPPDPAVEQIRQTLSSLQQAVQGIQSDQQKLAAQVNEIQQKASVQQGEQKLLSDQLGSLTSRLDSLASANAENPAATQQTAPAPQRAKRSKR
ncbi:MULTISPECIES: hypothetical protein [unclassified Bradyrhizobium]|uniref:hypothetical protein n=1 Tax=unclassified Bradyrhizobium TaxID=2631580 RepID=UPI0024798272|nr:MULTISPECIES: hypothetical protein [unclassified Bradyrhizobium]WGR97630.1 hypothetical protein MTX23_24970 [Bradyrhizobium sp. ISRA436]WGS04520.1 hypothetical protein MTX18_24975 [Bradyrhizobium sp. ISRA437]WGS11401.1 hypothetical protein MTX26_24975 [Bradyrhizobium sp. ISRA443]WGS18841.1 hypothetical protein MTX22_30605 [Bradyrhizobium sp. ISRA463]WGS25669.1 hypothetical protein MTX19_28180 [Bradyrhizobium sp. ISRA464]